MAATRSRGLQNSMPSRRSIRQKRDRRKASLMGKAYEYSKMCDADVFIGIHIRETGKVFTFLADASGFWTFLGSQLDSYYPTPSQMTDEELDRMGIMAAVLATQIW